MQHTEELGFRDFSSFMVKEDRNNWVTLRVAFLYKGQLKHRESLQMDERSESGDAMLQLESGDRIETF
jgi:hypothetical protein